MIIELIGTLTLETLLKIIKKKVASYRDSSYI